MNAGLSNLTRELENSMKRQELEEQNEANADGQEDKSVSASEPSEKSNPDIRRNVPQAGFNPMQPLGLDVSSSMMYPGLMYAPGQQHSESMFSSTYPYPENVFPMVGNMGFMFAPGSGSGQGREDGPKKRKRTNYKGSSMTR